MPNVESSPSAASPVGADSAFSSVSSTIEFLPVDDKEAVVQISNNARCQQLIRDFVAAAQKGAEAMITMARAAAVAKQEFEDDEITFRQFCDGIGHDPNGSEFRKLLVIGQKASRFKPYLNKLPDSKSTLYDIAKLDRNEFERVVASEQFGPDMTAKQLKVIVKGDTGSAPEPSYQVVIKLKGSDPTKLDGDLKRINEALKPIGYSGEANKTLKKLLAQQDRE